MSESLGTTPLDKLVAAFRAYMAIDDPAHIAFALAVAVAAQLDGDPLWGMLVGAPSSGKIETLRALDEVADEHLDDISAAGLLSWMPGKRQRPIGLLSRRQVPRVVAHGMVRERQEKLSPDWVIQRCA